MELGPRLRSAEGRGQSEVLSGGISCVQAGGRLLLRSWWLSLFGVSRGLASLGQGIVSLDSPALDLSTILWSLASSLASTLDPRRDTGTNCITWCVWRRVWNHHSSINNHHIAMDMQEYPTVQKIQIKMTIHVNSTTTVLQALEPRWLELLRVLYSLLCILLLPLPWPVHQVAVLLLVLCVAMYN